MNESSFSLPLQCAIRPACAQDMRSIRMLVWSAKLDPTQLRWQQFWVIECRGDLVACGQLRNFAGAQELAVWWWRKIGAIEVWAATSQNI